MIAGGGARSADLPASAGGPLDLIHRSKVPNPVPARVSGLSYTVRTAWHVIVFEDGQERGGAVFELGPEGRAQADRAGQRWLQNRRVADVRST